MDDSTKLIGQVKALEARVIELERYCQVLRNSLLSNWYEERGRAARESDRTDIADYNVSILSRASKPGIDT